jgi:hypothetical protein
MVNMPPAATPFSTHEKGLEQATERTGIEPVTSGLERRLRADLGATGRDRSSVYAASAQPDITANDCGS